MAALTPAPTNGKHAGGRPTKWRPEFVEEGRKLALLGATDVELADFFEVHADTIAEWKKNNAEFSGALKDGKLVADSGVADRLHQRAMGYEYDKAIPFKLKDVVYDKGKRVRETERLEVVTVREVVPPDTTAGIFWLKNRKPDQWRDRHDVEHKHQGAFVHFVAEMPERVQDVSAWAQQARNVLDQK